MSVKLDPAEVLKYLNELGYYNINAQQLKEFMRDLKVLIKYDIRKAEKENQENIPVNVPKYSTNESHIQENYCQTNCSATRNIQTNVFKPKLTSLHSASTVSSRARSASQPEKIPSVNFAQTRKTFSTAPNYRVSQTDSKMYPSVCTFSTATDIYMDDCSTTSGQEYEVCSKPSRAKSAFASTGLKPKVSFIRPRKPVYSSKSDPVALYHKYQTEWKKQKLPGEDKHSNLRWAIREKMLGEPDIRPVTVSSTRTSSTKRNRL